jgi:sortase A
LLFAAAASMLGYCGFVVVDAWIFQRRAGQELERRLHATRAPEAGAAAPSPRLLAAIGLDGLIGRIELSRIGLSAIVYEGTDKKTLRLAVGHIRSTPLPGQPGNTGLAGHRDTFFRPLKDIRQNDIITLTTLRGNYRYRVVSTRVVAPSEISVLNPTEHEVLTLVTCYPFYFVGSAPSRFIVRAEKII